MDTDSKSRPDETSQSRMPIVALACGALAVLLAIAMFWLIIPPILLGAAAIILAVRVRRNPGSSVRSRELAAAGMALGLAGMLYVPGGWIISEGGESYGRDCAINPSDC